MVNTHTGGKSGAKDADNAPPVPTPAHTASPEVANPDTICPKEVIPTTIDDIRTGGTISEGDYVGLTGVIVTGVGSSGYTVQDPADSDGQYSGLYIYTDVSPTVTRGDELNLLGTVGDYFGEAQLQDPIPTVTGTGSVTPVALTVANATDEAYEGVLVTLTDGAVTNLNYDCGVDGGPCDDAGLWEIDGSSGIVVFDRLYEDADWETQKGTLPLTGVMNYRWNRRRIMPRTAADFGAR